MRSWVTPIVLGLLAAAAPAHAVQSGQPGWIGISYEVRERGDGGAPRVIITEVRRGSPAESAGIRAGDRLVAIEDLTGADALMNVSRRLDLRAGQLVEMRLERDGRSFDLRLREGARPVELYTDPAIALAFQPDSMVETMFRAMDSLRIHLIEANDRADRVDVSAVRNVVRSASAASQIRVLAPQDRDAVAAPFEFFVFRGEQHDSLVREMDRLNRRLEQLRQQERARQSELRSSGRSQRGDLDRQLGEVRDAMEELSRQSSALRAAMAEAARATAGWQYTLTDPPEPPRAPAAPSDEPFRPLTPYLLGSNRVAGAQVVDLKPELGEYFGVDRGVLVVEVAPGTPAAIAGLRPGDVVTRLDQVGVTTVEELRFGVAQAGDTLPVTLVRRGTNLQVLLRRR